MNNDKRYQLIKPIVSNNIYETPTLKKASKMCFAELMKGGGNINDYTHFAIRDVDNNEIFTYKIHNQNKNPDNLQNIKLNPTITPDIANLININSKHKQFGGNEININGLEPEKIDEQNNLQKLENTKIQLIDTKLDNVEAKIDLAKNEIIMTFNKTIDDLKTIIEKKDVNKKEDSCLIC
jgi:hypothetical protein